jgi:hypothetical protein
LTDLSKRRSPSSILIVRGSDVPCDADNLAAEADGTRRL